MKILHTVEFYPPSQGGAQEVVRQLSERMVALGHDVTVATSYLPERKKKIINGVKIVEFKISGNLVLGISGEAKKYQDFLVNSDFDVVMNYAAQQWATDLAFEVLDKIKARKIIVPCGYSALHTPQYADYFKKLPAYLRKYDAAVYNSPTYQDIVFANKHGLKNSVVITNGADEREFSGRSPARRLRKKYGVKHFFILTIGTHNNSKGHDEMLDAFEHFPFPCTLMLNGNKIEGGCYEKCQARAKELNFFKRRRGKKIILTDLGREELVAALRSADLFMLLSNRESSPLVLFESAAAGTPFVSSNTGNAAEIAKWTGGGLITKTIPHPGRKNTDDVTVDIQATVDLLKKLWWRPLLRWRMGHRAKSAWRHKFTWQKITGEYLRLYGDRP